MPSLYSSLTDSSGLLYLNGEPKTKRRKTKYILRGILQSRLTSRWFKFMKDQELEEAAENHPYLYKKLQLPYLSRTLSASDRLEVLTQHYRFLRRQLSAEVRRSLFSKGVILATFETKEGDKLELRLIYSGWCPREGELMVQLQEAKTGSLFTSISFTLRRNAGGRYEVFIGGLQGRNGGLRRSSAARKDALVEITRGLYGLRPKALLLFALQKMCADWGIAALRAVSNKRHVHRHNKNYPNLHASYDSFWIESGGVPLADGNFILPSRFVPRDESTIKPKKRGLYRQRYVLMTEISDQIHQALQDFRSSHPSASVSSLSELSSDSALVHSISRHAALHRWAQKRRQLVTAA